MKMSRLLVSFDPLPGCALPFLFTWFPMPALACVRHWCRYPAGTTPSDNFSGSCCVSSQDERCLILVLRSQRLGLSIRSPPTK